MTSSSPAPKTSARTQFVPSERIDGAIYLIRRNKVLLDKDLAVLYGVSTKVLNQAVKRNAERFPEDFMFQLTEKEADAILRSQSVTSKTSNKGSRGGRRYLPYAFTEQGVAMLSGLLSSPRAIAVNVEIMRAFVRLREMIASSADLARKLNQLEKKYDAQFKAVFEAIRELMIPVEEDDEELEPVREMGFHTALKTKAAKG